MTPLADTVRWLTPGERADKLETRYHRAYRRSVALLEVKRTVKRVYPAWGTPTKTYMGYVEQLERLLARCRDRVEYANRAALMDHLTESLTVPARGYIGQ